MTAHPNRPPSLNPGPNLVGNLTIILHVLYTVPHLNQLLNTCIELIICYLRQIEHEMCPNLRMIVSNVAMT